jgi:signal transduction histidine kinase
MLTKIDCIKYKINESNKIIDNLLFFSRLRPPEYSMIKPYDLLHKCLAELQGVQTSGIKIIAKELESIKDLEIEADGHQFKEVFLNILNNACDAVDHKSGKIILIPEVIDHSLIVSVKDNGVGISKSHINQIRDPFFTTKSKGTGLGLTICQGIMNMHNGELIIKSRKGLGTTVTCIFPLTKDHHEQTHTYSGR